MKKWANGLVGAIVGAVAAALPAMLTDPEHFSPVDPNAWKHLVPLPRRKSAAQLEQART